MSFADMQKKIRVAQAFVEKHRERAEKGALRQTYHFMAEQGWMNDPNGLIYFQGQYHIFYQYNPFDVVWGTMYWGHAVSRDLIHWTHLPIALAPGEWYDNGERGGCFSGSALADRDRLYLFYTGSAEEGGKTLQRQCMAWSEDGITFQKYEKNPIIAEPPPGFDSENFRDPKVWKSGEHYYMVCGASKNGRGHVLLYVSDDLLSWTFQNVLFESRGEFGSMIECPDLFPLDGKYVLTFSPVGAGDRKATYLVGELREATGKFTYSVMGEVDWGCDFYAPQTFLDHKGRRLMLGWANEWEWMPWWTNPGPAPEQGWCGALSLPRELHLGEDGRLQCIPAEELKILRKRPYALYNLAVKEKKMAFPGQDGQVFEALLTLDLSRSTGDALILHLRQNGGEEICVRADFKEQMLYVDRQINLEAPAGKTRSPLLMEDPRWLKIHLYMDKNSVEIYTDAYKTVHSCNVTAMACGSQNELEASGGVVYLSALETWGLGEK